MALCLHTWGANSYGQLGQGHLEDQAAPRSSDTAALQERKVRAVSGGGGHSVLLTESGEVLVCGQNHRGQLGLGHTSDVLTFQLCASLSPRIMCVACGWDFTLFLSDCGKVLACGSNTFGQLGVRKAASHSAEPLLSEGLEGEVVVGVAAGLRHSLAVTCSGRVYQWGTGLLSGAKKALGPQPVPPHLASNVAARVPGLDQHMAQQVAAGSAHCICLTGEGDLFVWGSNKHGQLTATEPFLSHPARLARSLLGEERVRLVCSGWTHIVAKTESGRVFTWGREDYGQLGRGKPTTGLIQERRQAGQPTEVKELFGATQIACGSEHNLAILGSRLLSWGWNEHGMCGDGSEVDVLQPGPVRGLRPLLIGCGAGHSMAMCTAETDVSKDEDASYRL